MDYNVSQKLMGTIVLGSEPILTFKNMDDWGWGETERERILSKKKKLERKEYI